MSKKRRRESAANIDTQLIEIYEDLANEDQEIILKAAQALVARFNPENQPTNEQIEKALNRLFRGLCSGRKVARIGFSIALTEVLTLVCDGLEWSAEKVVGILEKQTTVGGSVSGQEERDHHFGRLFGAEAIIKSSILFQSIVPIENWTKILDLIYDLAKKKPWLREECGWIIFCCVRDLASKLVDGKYAKAALDHLCSNDLTRTPEGVAVWLAVKNHFSTVKLPESIWSNGDPLSKREKATLAKVMKEASTSQNEPHENQVSAQKGNWNSKLHFAWDVVLAEFYERDEQPGWSQNRSSKPKRVNFVDFWIEMVDDSLFAAAASNERKHWGFLVFIKVLQSAPQHLAALVFSKNLMRCLINHLSIEDRYLHRIAGKAVKAIQARVSMEAEFAGSVLSGLLGPSGAINFDQMTKTKTVEKILAETSRTELTQILQLFEGLILRPDVSDAKMAASRRQILAEYLISIIRSRASSAKGAGQITSDGYDEAILLLFVKFAFFVDRDDSGQPGRAPEPPMSETTQESFRNRIISALNSLTGATSNPATLPYSVVLNIRNKERDDRTCRSILDMDETVSESLKIAWKMLKSFDKMGKSSQGEDTSHLHAIKLLYSLTILEVYNGDGDAVSMLEELHTCSKRLAGPRPASHGSTGEESEVLVDILLSFASKPSQLFRKMSQQVFGAFAPQMTADGLRSLTAVLEAKESLAGQRDMFDEQDEAENDDDDVEMSDVEEVNGDIQDGERPGDEHSEVTSSSDDDNDDENEADSDDEADNDELAAFDAKLAAALGAHRGDEDLQANKCDDSSDSDMDDEQMEALDHQLEEVFRARKNATSKKQQKKDARETMVNFKTRVLDLLEIYVKKQHSNNLALDIILPLLRIIRKTNAKQLSQRACGVMREYSQLCKGKNVPTIKSADPVWKLLREIHAEAMLGGSNAHATACSQASLLLVKTLIGYSKEAISGVVDIYSETRKQQLQSKKCHVQPSFFTEWNNWCVSASKQLQT